MLNQRLEEASLNAWPGLQQTLFDGWILRFAGGYTKRANSVNPLYPSRLEVQAKIAACERFYAAQNLPAIFRLTPFASPENLDAVLADCGYEKIDLTLVRYLDLAAWSAPAVAPVTVTEEPLEAWLEIFSRLAGAEVSKHQAHRRILQAIPYRRYFLAAWIDDQPVCCGLAVREDALVGIFDLVTVPAHRQRGYGQALVEALLGRAKADGAAHAYLQVMAANAPALSLYNKIGFTEAYAYWYRRK